MFGKILIANRGEIACRVIATAKRLGIRTVAVYSDADRDALHVRLADEAVHIGPPPAAQSYLLADRIIAACKQTGAEAVHPGYGFLSENPRFAEALAAAGIVFIGPPPTAVAAMGDKVTSKKIAADAGVNVIPGALDVMRDADHAVEIARAIGYPVMLKASAGGGGKGMRIAHNDRECREGFARSSSEAASSFGDARVFVEKFIEQPRHIEIQVIADAYGSTLYLNERECSVQRRHQKVLEESPSPFLDAATRRAMGEQAVALARAVGYTSAGTVEFVVDARRNFYFLEMNTRLQVEHPVTEFVTGLDLVELMLLVAAGERLPLTQEQVRLDGWAVEARVYAEDPFRKFLPSTGRLVRYAPPPTGEGVRVDTGVYEGGEVSMYYDPMIAKLVTHGASRDEALLRLRTALDRFVIRGVQHNISFLTALVQHPRFVEGRITTNFIAEEYPNGFHPGDVPHENPSLIAAVAAAIHRLHSDREATVSGQLPGHERVVPDEWVVLAGGESVPARVVAVPGGHDVTWQGALYAVRSDWRFGEPLFTGTVNNAPVAVQVERRGIGYRLSHSGSQSDVLVLSRREAELQALMPHKPPPDLSRFLLSPMPGLLVSIAVAPGQEVKEGEVLAVVEAMKMENTLLAQRDAVVAAVLARKGDSLAVDQPILEFKQ
ncbi:MAG TPA: acetyl/propionyl/methylcrotonyl-CoA carboxylase subunit alpha [bacterium]